MSDFISILVLALLAFAVLSLLSSGPSRGRGQSLDFNRQVGEWRVRYPDGALSQPFCRDVAEDYASMFGGRVVPR